MPNNSSSLLLAVVVAWSLMSAGAVAAPAGQADNPSSGAQPVKAERSTQTSAPVSPGAGGSADASPPKELPAGEVPKPEVLKQRAQQRWDALVKKDFATAYGYETPGYRKEATLERYTSNFGHSVRWYLATVKELRYHPGNEAKVIVALEYSFPLAGSDEMVRSTTRLVDTWAYLDGQWWRSQKPRPLRSGSPVGSGAKGDASAKQTRGEAPSTQGVQSEKFVPESSE